MIARIDFFSTENFNAIFCNPHPIIFVCAFIRKQKILIPKPCVRHKSSKFEQLDNVPNLGNPSSLDNVWDDGHDCVQQCKSRKGFTPKKRIVEILNEKSGFVTKMKFLSILCQHPRYKDFSMGTAIYCKFQFFYKIVFLRSKYYDNQKLTLFLSFKKPNLKFIKKYRQK
jgi:hypothetical protein